MGSCCDYNSKETFTSWAISPPCFCCSSVWFWDRDPCSTDWPLTHYMKTDLQLWTLKCGDHSCAWPLGAVIRTYLFACLLCAYISMQDAEVRGQFCGVCSRLPLLRGFPGLNSGHQVCAFPGWDISPPSWSFRKANLLFCFFNHGITSPLTIF